MGFFDFDVRVVVCNHCNAPIQASALGGNVRCEYCNQINRIKVRLEEPVEPIMAAQETIDEARRIEMLRKQVNNEISIPWSLKSLLNENSEIPEWKIQEAQAIWQGARAQLEKAMDFDQAETFWVLTYKLAEYFESQKKTAFVRGIYERALDVLTLPRHRQIIRGFLSRQAALTGDLASAEKWLAPCNPRSTDLHSDTEYRFSRACIDTVKEDWHAVLEVLGRSHHEVPTMALNLIPITVLRANALEKLGQLDAAFLEIAEYYEPLDRVVLSQMHFSNTGKHSLDLSQEYYSNYGVNVCTRCGLEKWAVLIDVKKAAQYGGFVDALKALQKAHEKETHGEQREAVKLLADYIGQSKTKQEFLWGIAEIFRQAGEVRCPTSLNVASAEQGMAKRSNAKNLDIGISGLLFPFLMLPFTFFVSEYLGSKIPAYFEIVVFGIPILALAVIVFFAVMKSRTKTRIVVSGIEAEAVVEKIEKTSTTVNKVRVMSVSLNILESGDSGHLVEVKLYEPDCVFKVGDKMDVLLDPLDEKKAMILL